MYTASAVHKSINTTRLHYGYTTYTDIYSYTFTYIQSNAIEIGEYLPTAPQITGCRVVVLKFSRANPIFFSLKT